MTEAERLVADYDGMGLTIGRHPMALCRHDLSMRGVLRAADLPQAADGRRVRVATKYMNLTRRFFSQKGVTGYRIVESLGATEGAPAAHSAELIVDITTTGATLRANGLKVLDDGVILESQANLVSSTVAPWSPELRRLEREVAARLAV